MRRLRAQDREDGVSIIEVMVALMIFTVVALGLAYSMATMTKLTYESSNRETAANLASAEIDRLQALPDAFDVHSDLINPVTVDGITYNLADSVGWVSANGASGSCGTGGGNLQYKRLNVVVTWPGMIYANPVRADSTLAPDSRINDPSYGTIVVGITGFDGTGRSGVTVTVTPETGGGGVALTDPVDPTDSDGCAFALKVSPGKYKVVVSRSGYVDDAHSTTTTFSQQVVAAGGTLALPITYDAASNFSIKYAANSALNPLIPSNLETTLVNDHGNKTLSAPASTIQLFPWTGGYQAIAGDFSTAAGTGCKNVDPTQWLESTTLNAGVRAVAVQTSPGGSANLPVPMGIVSLTAPVAGKVSAVQQTTGPNGDPGCTSPTTYNFTPNLTSGQAVNIALPYGSWKIYVGTTQVTAPAIVGGVVDVDDTTGALVPGLTGGASVVTAGIATIDPRLAK
jgi:type II secretory pathway pseudopilin PulG